VLIRHLELVDFRSYERLDLSLCDGLTAIIGPNGVGKTNVVEALGLLATLKSFRGAPTESLVRRGAATAIVRATGERDGRSVSIDLELGKGRTRAQVNQQRLQRSRDLLGALRVTVFAPDDLALIKDGPALRRDFLDDVIVSLDPSADRVLRDVEKILKQRNALLRQAGGRLDDAAAGTLDVWDLKLAAAGEHLTVRRENTLALLMPGVAAAYDELAGEASDVVAFYERSWSGESLSEGVAEARDHDVRRAITSVGPHRDDVSFHVNGFDSRVEASQGEQRTLALALRLGGHRLIAEQLGEAPLLLLDDVLSELDPDRARVLLATLPPGQTIITSASELPAGTVPEQTLRPGGTGFIEFGAPVGDA
jgi:DNA replication and repair protein RecF